MQQRILRVDFVTGANGIDALFAPMMNRSQIKHTNNISNLKSLEEMNNDGWKLENILPAFDDKGLHYQLAIFTKE